MSYTYIRSGPYKSQQAIIMSKKPVHDKPYLYRVSLPNHKTILIDRANLSFKNPIRSTPIHQKSPIKATNDRSSAILPLAPETNGCCYVGLCELQHKSITDKCCCPSFVRCRTHGKYTMKNLKPKTLSKIVVLPIGSPDLFRSTVMSYDKKKKRCVKRVVVQDEKYEFEDNFNPSVIDDRDDELSEPEEYQESKEEKNCRLVLELVSPEELMSAPRRLKKKRGRRNPVRFVGGNIYPEDSFPIGLPTSDRLVRYGGMSEEYLRNVRIYEGIVASRS